VRVLSIQRGWEEGQGRKGGKKRTMGTKAKQKRGWTCSPLLNREQVMATMIWESRMTTTSPRLRLLLLLLAAAIAERVLLEQRAYLFLLR
jgi:hypothetical protein